MSQQPKESEFRSAVVAWAPAVVAVALGVLAGIGSVDTSGLIVAFGFVGVLTVFVVTFYRPMWGLYLLVVLLPLRLSFLMPRLPLIDLQFLPYRLPLAALLLTLAIRAPWPSLKKVLWAPLTPPMLMLISAGVLSSLFAADQAVQIRAIFQLGVCFGVYALIPILVNTPQKYSSVCKVMAVTALIYAVYGIVDYVLYLKGFPSNTRMANVTGTIAPPRTNGVCEDPNIYIFRILPALCLIPSWVSTLSPQSQRIGRWVWFFTITVLLALLPLTASRGSAVALVLLSLSVAVFAFGRGQLNSLEKGLRRLWMQGIGLAIVLAIVLGGVVAVSSPMLVLRVQTTFTKSSLTSGRFPTYQEVVNSSPRHPFGRGLSANLQRGPEPLHSATHNNLLQILAEMGYLGVLTYLWLLAATATVARRVPRAHPLTPWMGGIVLGLLGAYYCSIFLSYYFDESTTLLWGMLVSGGWLTNTLRPDLPQDTLAEAGLVAREGS
ncbi:MAG: O-antigen ligase family protein [Armatimonadota bacterium]